MYVEKFLPSDQIFNDGEVVEFFDILRIPSSLTIFNSVDISKINLFSIQF